MTFTIEEIRMLEKLGHFDILDHYYNQGE